MVTRSETDARIAAMDEALERDDFRELYQSKAVYAALSADASLAGDTKGAKTWAGLHAQARDRLGVLLARRRARQAAQAQAVGRVALFEFGGA